ncbi:hypothetical protein [Stenotrophomonas maltophilia]|uniref:hypothetical protein n=1 Tax=Stenotrophomonas maltophilia TaxID=40324 RepID=UPI002ED8B24F
MVEKSHKKIHFGSKFLALHGRLLIANATEFLGKRKNMEGSVAQSFYYLEQDRYLPNDKSKSEEWEQDQLLATQVVEEFRRPLALRAVLLVFFVALALGAIGGTLSKFKEHQPGSLDSIKGTVINAINSANEPEPQRYQDPTIKMYQ